MHTGVNQGNLTKGSFPWAERTTRRDRRMRGLPDRSPADKDITRQVKGRLSKDAQLKKVDVRIDGGAVILMRAVSSIGASARASELARGA